MLPFITVVETKTELLKKINKHTKEFCMKENMLFIDLYSCLADENGKLPAEYTDDGVHLNDTGSDKLTHFFYARLKEYNISDFPNP